MADEVKRKRKRFMNTILQFTQKLSFVKDISSLLILVVLKP